MDLPPTGSERRTAHFAVASGGCHASMSHEPPLPHTPGLTLVPHLCGPFLSRRHAMLPLMHMLNTACSAALQRTSKNMLPKQCSCVASSLTFLHLCCIMLAGLHFDRFHTQSERSTRSCVRFPGEPILFPPKCIWLQHVPG